MRNYKELAIEHGFSDANLIRVDDITLNHSFRKYCEENLCGFYGKNYACPPYCGTPEEMEEKVRKYQNALILKTSYEVNDAMDGSVMNPLKKKHTKMTLSLIKEIQKEDPCDYTGVMAGPCCYCSTCKMTEGQPCTYENMRFSCLSAYCIDVTKLATVCDMEISWDIHSASFFSIYLF